MKMRRFALAVIVIWIFMLLAPVAGLDFPRVIETITTKPQLVMRYLLIGLSNGAIYAIIALGYTMVYGIIQLINFAHGEVFMMSTFMSLTVIALMGTTNKSDPGQILITIVVAMLVAILFGGLLNASVERLA